MIIYVRRTHIRIRLFLVLYLSSAFSFNLVCAQQETGSGPLLADSLQIAELMKRSAMARRYDMGLGIAYAQEALCLAQEAGLVRQEARALYRLGGIAIQGGDFEEAIHYISQGKQLAEQTDDDRLRVSAHNLLGLTHSRVGNYEVALEHFLTALKLDEQLGSKDITLAEHTADLYATMGDTASAVKYYRHALHIRKSRAEREEAWRLLEKEGVILHTQKKYARAIVYYDSALLLLQGQQNLTSLGRITHRKALALVALHEYEAAIQELRKAIAWQEEIGDHFLIQSTNLAAKVYIHLGRLQQAIALSKKSLELLQNRKDLTEKSVAYQNLYQAYGSMGDFRRAYVYHQRYGQLKDSLMNQQKSLQILGLQMKFDHENQADENEKLLLANQLNEKTIRNQLYVILLALALLLLAFVLIYNFHQARLQSRAEYELLYEHVNEGVVMLEREGIRHCNRKAADILGLGRHPLKGQSLLQAIQQAGFHSRMSDASFQRKITAAYSQDFSLFEWELVHTSGKVSWLEVHLNRLKTRKLPSLLVFLRDISERKAAEEQLALELREKNALINNTDDLVWSIDHQMRLRSFNQPFARMMESVTGRPLKAGDLVIDPAFVGELVEKWRRHYERALKGEKFMITDATEIDGQMYFADTSFYPIMEGDKLIGVSCFSKDVTEKMHATLALKASEEKYRTQMERITDAFVAFDNDWNYTYVNAKAGELLGRDPASLIGKNVWEEFPEGVGQPFYQALHEARRKQQFIHVELYYPPWDKWYEDHIYPSPEGVSVFYHDITERKKTQQALQQREAQLSLIFNSVAEMMLLVKRQPAGIFVVETANEKFLEMLRVSLPGISMDQLRGAALNEFLSQTVLINEWESYERSIGRMHKALESGEVHRFELKTLSKGKLHAYQVSITPIAGLGNQYDMLLLVIHDLSEKLQQEERTLNAVYSAIERERKRIAGELHDSLTQTLSIASMNLKNLSYDFPSLEEAPKYAKALYFVEEAIDESRSLSHRIMPKAIEDFGLLASVEELAEKTRKVQPLEVHLQFEGDFALSKEMELNLFRIIQEAFNNILKHARANNIWLSLKREASGLSLLIKDDGRGFVPQSLDKQGIGLRSMQGRVNQMGGIFVLESQPFAGTCISVTIPIHDQVSSGKI